MKGIELLNKYPLATVKMKEWFLKQMIESFNDSIPGDFQIVMLDQGIGQEQLGTLIDINPRLTFDCFDTNGIFICTPLWIKTPGDFKNVEFGISINATNKDNSNFSKRKEAELVAVEEAFELLEEQLNPLEFPKLENND